jgi:hypothetical protein
MPVALLVGTMCLLTVASVYFWLVRARAGHNPDAKE